MEKTIKNRLLESMGKVYEQSKGCKLESSFFETIKNELTVLSEYFEITQIQSLLVAIVFSLNYQGKDIDFSDLTEYFGSNPMKLLEFNADFEILYSKEIIIKERNYN